MEKLRMVKKVGTVILKIPISSCFNTGMEDFASYPLPDGVSSFVLTYDAAADLGII